MNNAWYYARYRELLTRASLTRPVRTRSSEYMAALYILAYDKEIFEIVSPYVSESGIDFDNIQQEMEERCMEPAQHTMVSIARSLFHLDLAEPLFLSELLELDYDRLDVIVDALYIRKNCGRIPKYDEHGNMTLDKTREQEIRAMMASCMFRSED